MAVRAALFDLDDTLQDREAAFRDYSADLVRRLTESGVSRPEQAGAMLAFLRDKDERGYRERRELFDEMTERFGLGCASGDLQDD